MRFMIILFAVLFTSCKTENNILAKGTPPKPNVTNEVNTANTANTTNATNATTNTANVVEVVGVSELIVDHEVDQSLLRSELMKNLIHERFGNENIGKSDYSSLVSKEFAFKKSTHEANLEKIEDFKSSSRGKTRIIVSYSDHLEAYLVPVGISIEFLIKQLNLKEESSRTLVFLGESSGVSAPEKALYVLSVNHDDLINEDKKNYFEIVSKNDLNSTHEFKLRKGQEAEIEVSYEYYVQSLITASFDGRNSRCTKDLVEAGGCDPCTFSRQSAGSTFTPAKLNRHADLGLSVTVNGKERALNEFNIAYPAANFATLTIREEVYSENPKFSVTLFFKPGSFAQTFEAFNFQGNCTGSRSYPASFNLVTTAAARLKIKIKGRGEVLRGIKL